jgi:hypothetical protein
MALAMAVSGLIFAQASAQTVYTGDVIQGKQVISQLDVGDLEPGTRVVQILHTSADPECDEDGCPEAPAEYLE